MRKNLLLLGLAVCTVATAADPAYDERSVEGWRVIIEKSLAAQSPDTLTSVLAVLSAQLHAITRVVPPPALEKIQAVPVWIHRQSGTKCMAFHPSAKWLGEHGFNQRMADGVEIGDVANFLDWTKQQPWMVLHELAHAYHFRVLGRDNKDVERRWESARAEGKYERVLHISGRMRRHYGLNNAGEYFAELSESYFGTNDFYPFVRAELQKHDPEGFEMVRRMWKGD